MSKKKPQPTGKEDGQAVPCPWEGLLPGEERDIRREAAAVVADAPGWLDAPNDQLGGQRPRDLIGTDREQHVRDLLRAIKHGMPT